MKTESGSVGITGELAEAVLAIRPGRPWPTQTKFCPTYTTPVGLSKICLDFDWPTNMKIPRTAPGGWEGGSTP